MSRIASSLFSSAAMMFVTLRSVVFAVHSASSVVAHSKQNGAPALSDSGSLDTGRLEYTLVAVFADGGYQIVAGD